MSDSTARSSGQDDALPAGAEQVLDFALSNPDVFKLIGERAAAEVARRTVRLTDRNYANKLRERLNALVAPSVMEVGDLVRWKPGLRNRQRPALEEIGVLVERIGAPTLDDSKSSGSPYFGERLDIIVGLLEPDETLTCYHFDSRRFERVDDSEVGGEPDL